MRSPRALARFRRRAAGVAWRAALGPVSGRLPRRYVASIVASLGDATVDRHVAAVELLESAHVEHYPLAEDLPLAYRRAKAFDDRHLYRLRDVCASARSGLCWLPEGLILSESIGSLNRLLGWGAGALEDPLFRLEGSITGPAVLLPSNRYYHFLLEDSPALLHARRHEPDATVLVARDAPTYIEEVLVLLDVRDVRRLDAPVRVEQLVLTARSPGSGFVLHADVELLRAALRTAVEPRQEAALYVSRRLDPRAPANEPALERALAAEGFTVVAAQTLGLREQIELFAGARVVAGAHGAGLANIVWSDAGALLELFVNGSFNDCYARLATSLGGAYRPFHCCAEPPPHGSAPIAEIAAGARELLD